MDEEELLPWMMYQVQSGDTLSTIAQRFQLRTRDIKQLNSLKDSRIYAGKTLRLPASKELKKAQIKLAYLDSDAKRKKYTVNSGDSLWVIANRHKISIQRLAKINKRSIRSTLYPGDVLFLE